MNTKKNFVIDEDFSSQDEETRNYPLDGNENISFYRRQEGNKFVSSWYDVTAAEPRLIKEIISPRKISSTLYGEDFAVIKEEKVSGLPKMKIYQLVIRKNGGEYVDMTSLLTGAFAIVCKGYPCVITSITRQGEVYEIHFRAKGFDRSQCYRKNDGKLAKISDSEARRLRHVFLMNERAERLCKSGV